MAKSPKFRLAFTTNDYTLVNLRREFPDHEFKNVGIFQSSKKRNVAVYFHTEAEAMEFGDKLTGRS